MQNSSGPISRANHQGRKTQGFKDLIAWQRAMQLVRVIYDLTAQFPQSEQYSLSGQMRRAAYSIPANVAEGYSRTTLEYRKFLTYSRGSNFELESQILIAKTLQFAPPQAIDRAEKLCQEVGRLLTGLMRSLSR